MDDLLIYYVGARCTEDPRRFPKQVPLAAPLLLRYGRLRGTAPRLHT